jgi:hypothetical protein
MFLNNHLLHAQEAPFPLLSVPLVRLDALTVPPEPTWPHELLLSEGQTIPPVSGKTACPLCQLRSQLHSHTGMGRVVLPQTGVE